MRNFFERRGGVVWVLWVFMGTLGTLGTMRYTHYTHFTHYTQLLCSLFCSVYLLSLLSRRRWVIFSRKPPSSVKRSTSDSINFCNNISSW